jgi:putative SOS response-associated peptidase YedK
MREELLDLLQRYPAACMRAYPISMRVNSVRDDDLALLERAS